MFVFYLYILYSLYKYFLCSEQRKFIFLTEKCIILLKNSKNWYLIKKLLKYRYWVSNGSFCAVQSVVDFFCVLMKWKRTVSFKICEWNVVFHYRISQDIIHAGSNTPWFCQACRLSQFLCNQLAAWNACPTVAPVPSSCGVAL